MPVSAGEASGALADNAVACAVDTGLFASDVLSQLPRPTCAFVTACGLLVFPVWLVSAPEMLSVVSFVAYGLLAEGVPLVPVKAAFWSDVGILACEGISGTSGMSAIVATALSPLGAFAPLKAATWSEVMPIAASIAAEVLALAIAAALSASVYVA